MVPAPRFPALDVLRGIAVMGILLMNVVGFGLPQAAYLNPAAYGGTGTADLAAWTVSFVLVDGKMRALFSLLFGAGMVLVIDRAEAAGQDSAAFHLRRMAALLAIGIVHAFLLWSGDILIPYAIVGTIALAHVRRSTRSLLAIAVMLLLAQWLLLWTLVGGLDAVRDAARVPDAPAAAIQAWRGIADQIGIPSPAAIGRELAIFRGDYGGILQDRLRHAQGPLLQLIDVGAETLALMLLGIAALRSGFLTGQWSGATYRRIALGAYAVSIPPLVLIATSTIRSGFDEVATVHAATLYAAPLRIALMFAHVAFVLALLDRRREGWLFTRIGAVGRAAFSNYLATSIVMTTIFYGYGLGWFGHLSRAQLYVVIPPVWIAMLAWSEPWLARYRFGPCEWLWRSLARGQLQSMRRAAD